MRRRRPRDPEPHRARVDRRRPRRDPGGQASVPRRGRPVPVDLRRPRDPRDLHDVLRRLPVLQGSREGPAPSERHGPAAEGLLHHPGEERGAPDQTYDNRELIVVDDGSTDKTPAILDGIAATHPGVRVVHLAKNMGKKKAIEAAIPYATGSIFAFADSDSVLGKHAIERLVKAFNAHPNAGAVSAHGRALNAGTNLLTKVQDTWYEGQFRLSKGLESVYGAVTCASGCLSAFRREAFEPFVHEWAHDTFLGKEFKFATDRQMTGYVLREGRKKRGKHTTAATDGGNREAPRKWEVLYSQSARVWTEVPATWRKFLRQQARWKKSFIRNLFFTGRFYWRRPPLAALAFYLGILFVLVGPLIAFRAIYFLTAGGDFLSAPLYLSGVTFVGLLYGLDYKLRNPDSTYWLYRPLMSLISTFILSWLLIYAAFTIRNPSWLTR